MEVINFYDRSSQVVTPFPALAISPIEIQAQRGDADQSDQRKKRPVVGQPVEKAQHMFSALR